MKVVIHIIGRRYRAPKGVVVGVSDSDSRIDRHIAGTDPQLHTRRSPWPNRAFSGECDTGHRCSTHSMIGYGVWPDHAMVMKTGRPSCETVPVPRPSHTSVEPYTAPIAYECLEAEQCEG